MSARTYFGSFVLDHEKAQLLRASDAQPLALTAQPFKVLAFLVTHAGEVVSREELQKHVWGDTIVEYDQGINACIRQIRAVLGDNADEPKFIQTLRGKGYRFLAPLAPSDTPSAREVPRRTRTLLAGVFGAGVLLAALVLLVTREKPSAPPVPNVVVQAATANGLTHLFHFEDPVHRDSARQSLMAATRADYTHAPAIAGVAILFALQGSESGSLSTAQTARQVLERAASLAPREPVVRVAQAVTVALLDHDPNRGRTILDTLLQQDSSNASALYVAGRIAGQAGQWSVALDRLQAAERVAPGATGAAFELASAFANLRMWERAAEWLARAQRQAHTPAAGVLGVRVALARARSGDVFQAVHTCLGDVGCARALQSDPSLARRVAPLLPVPNASERTSWGNDPRALTAAAEVIAAKSGPASARAAYASAHGSLLAADTTAGHPRRAWAGLAVIAGGELARGVAILVADTIATPMPRNALAADDRRNALALGLVRAARMDEAMDLVRRLLAAPGALTIQELSTDAVWAPLRRHPDFSELVRTWSSS